MDILTPQEINNVISSSSLVKKYNEELDRESAFELLMKKLTDAPVEEAETVKKKSKDAEKSIVGEIADSTVGRQVMRTVARELTRGLMGVLGISGSKRRK